jgi:acyl transferase domain-containing protein
MPSRKNVDRVLATEFMEKIVSETLHAGRLKDSAVEDVEIPGESSRLSEDSIVIVGAACRFPGCDSLDAYWRNLIDGRSCVSEVRRWPMAHPVHGGLLEDVAGFDAGFFRISPNEARSMDPQQRILLEVAHHAIDDCGAGLAALRELSCGVFCSSLPGDYKFLLAHDPEHAFSSQSFLGNATSSLSGRISYFYDLKGPSITLDTACSSSLTALQIACLQLRTGQCGAALVGAVSIFATSEMFEFAGRAGMISGSGRCAAFSELADGFVPSEGAAAVMLTTAAVAARLGLEVLATIEAIALNHDGQSNGLMAPNAQAQRELIEGLYRRSKISVTSVGYVEAHGTGTKLGDPIELRGLAGAFGELDPAYDAYLGGSKSVIGHTLVCSGLASLIKGLLVLRHRLIPAHPVPGPINAEIDLGRFLINDRTIPWPEHKRYVAISAFGFTGSNGHLILGPGWASKRDRTPRETRALPFLFSAQSPQSLAKLVQLHAEAVVANAAYDLHALSATLTVRAMHYRHRVAVVASTRTGLLAGLRRLGAEFGTVAGGGDADRCQVADDTDPALIARVKRWVAGEHGVVDAEPSMTRIPKCALPPYPFDRRSYWIGDAPCARNPSIAGQVDDGHAMLVSVLKRKLGETLGFAPSDIDAQRPMRDFGIDSITIIQMLAELGPAAARLQPHDVFEYPSLDAFARDLAMRANEIDAQGPVSATPTTRRPAMAASLLRWHRAGAGNGRPILLLPPLNMSVDAWSQQTGFLRRLGWAPHIPLYPGHEDNPMTDAALDGAAIDRRAIVEEIAARIRTDFGRVPLVGWSLGGCFSLDIAASAPDLVSSMVLISTAAAFDDDIFGKTIELNAELEANAELLDIVLGTGRSLVERIGAGANMDVLSRYYRMLGEFDVSASLPAIRTRSLIVHGRRDAVVGDADLARLRRLPNAEVVELPEHGHFAPLLAAARFNRLLGDFLAGDLDR